MKRFLTTLIFVFAATILFAQTATNYKEGDFTGKQIKAKSAKIDTRWTVTKGTDNSLTFSYNGTAKATLSSAGVWTSVSTATPAATAALTSASTITATKVRVTADTAVTDPLYTIAVKGAHVYVKIAATGATSDRWKQIDN